MTVHVKNLEKYQSGYKDRRHYWAKIYFDSFLDAEFQNLDEIDRYRFWSLVVYEVYLEGKPVVLNDVTTNLLGWNTKKRAKSLTLQMLHTLVDDRNGNAFIAVTQSRVEKSRVEKNMSMSDFNSFWEKYPRKEAKATAQMAWQKLSPSSLLVNEIISAVAARSITDGWTKDGGKYIPLPATYLNGRRWEDGGLVSILPPCSFMVVSDRGHCRCNKPSVYESIDGSGQKYTRCEIHDTRKKGL